MIKKKYIFKPAKVNFNSKKIKKELEAVKREIELVNQGAKIDTSKLHVRFN